MHKSLEVKDYLVKAKAVPTCPYTQPSPAPCSNRGVTLARTLPLYIYIDR